MENLANSWQIAKLLPSKISWLIKSVNLKFPFCLITIMSGILKYFHRANNSRKDNDSLPDPDGELSMKIPSSSITSANSMVNEVLEKPRGKRGTYLALTPAQKYAVGKRAAESGVTTTIRYYAKAFPNIPLKETLVQRMKNDYLSHLKTSESSKDVQELPGKKRGRPLLLGDQLDKQVRDYIVYLRPHGCIINAHVVIAVGKGIIMGKDSNLLYSNGGSLVLMKDWARNIFNRMGLVR